MSWELLFSIGTRSFRRSFTNAGLRDRARRAKPRTLADAPEGVPVRVAGTIRALDRMLEAPLAGSPCVYHATHVDLERELTIRPHVRWTAATRFVLECGTDHAIVDAAHVLVSARVDHETTSTAAFDAAPRQRALLDRAPLASWFDVLGVVYYEAILTVGQPIVLFGAGTRDLVPGAGDYRSTGTRMHFAGTAKHPLVVCDHPDEL